MNKFIPQKLYNQILENVPIACVDVAIVARESVLLVMRKNPPVKGRWWLPGGRVLKGEKMKETAIRKAREEVETEGYVGPIIHTSETIFPDGPDGIPVHTINSCFIMYPFETDCPIRLDEHHLDYKWVNHIPDGLHPYVERCLMSAGLLRKGG
ncbi:NUDIX domain-containing protein [Desulfobacterales bacterium HSG2]|nr:NUDIX domain-containing protein [Desulfobacterales bacterium HSG2]